MIQFARAVGLELSSTSFGMLDDLLLKDEGIGRGGGKASSRPAFLSCAGTSVGDSMASHSMYSFPNIPESTKSDQVVIGSQEFCSNRQADEVLASVCLLFEKSETDSLNTLGEMNADLVKTANKPFR